MDEQRWKEPFEMPTLPATDGGAFNGASAASTGQQYITNGTQIRTNYPCMAELLQIQHQRGGHLSCMHTETTSHLHLGQPCLSTVWKLEERA